MHPWTVRRPASAQDSVVTARWVIDSNGTQWSGFELMKAATPHEMQSQLRPGYGTTVPVRAVPPQSQTLAGCERSCLTIVNLLYEG